MNTFCKLYKSITSSTLWGESKDVKILFVTMLAEKDANGIVHGTASGLARLAVLTMEETLTAIRVLESPDKLADPNVKQEFDGRRIERVDGGWRVLNHVKYRDMKSPGRAEYQAKWQREYRKRKKNISTLHERLTIEAEQDGTAPPPP